MEWWREYIRRGWPVFPVEPGGKAPDPSRAPNGFYNATLDEAVAAAWFGQPSEPINVGVRTGAGLVVVDFDVDKMTDESRALLELLPRTFEVNTGSGGLHCYYSYDKPLGNRVGLLPGVDIRADGGYVVAPDSVLAGGRPYRVFRDAPLEPLPDVVLSLLEKKKTTAPLETFGDVAEGGRNDYLARAAGKMQRGGILTLDGLLALNQEKCAPPLPDYEVRAIYESITRYRPADPVVAADASPLILRADSFSAAMVSSLSDKSKVKGLSTGYPDLDRMLGGGYRLGELTALTASAKTGKSTLTHALIYNLVSKGIPVGYASREMRPADEVLPNLLSIAHKENAWLARMDQGRCAAYEKSITSWPLYFSPGYGFMPIDDIRAWVQALVAIGVHYFFADHLHYLLSDPEDYKAAVMLAQELKSLVIQYNISLFCIIQPGKLMEGERLSFQKMRGGAGVAQALDNVLILDRHRGLDGRLIPNISKLTLDIARHKLAKPGQMYFEYNPETTEFFEAEQAAVEDPEPAHHG